MVININPNRLRQPSGEKAGERRLPVAAEAEIIVPSRAHVNFIPSPESLRSLIAGGVAALRKGVAWDRGTILNLLV